MTVERYPRSARRYHTAVYVVTLLLLATGWWLLAGREGEPSPISRLIGVPDARIHTVLGWVLVVVGLLPLPFAIRGIVRFARETFRYHRGDLRWLARLPAAVFMGLVAVHGGPLFAVLAAIHRLTTIAFTVVIVGHVVVALGILPGYRGVWRSMHLGGRVRLDTARRLWPGWTDRETARRAGSAPPGAPPIPGRSRSEPSYKS